MTFAATLLTIVILVLLISKTDKIIEFLRLDKDSGIKAQVYTQGIDELDEFNFPNSVDYGEWIITGLNVFLDFLLLMNYGKISKWLVRKDSE